MSTPSVLYLTAKKTQKNDKEVELGYTVAYEFDSESKTLKYAATMLRGTPGHSKFDAESEQRARAVEKAKKRLQNRPLTVSDVTQVDADTLLPLVKNKLQEPTETVKRVFRFKEDDKTSRRLFTVAYNYNRKTQVLQYGGAVYRTGKTGTFACSKKTHRVTAEGRLAKRPVVVENFTDDGDLDVFHDKLKKLVRPEGQTTPHVKGLRRQVEKTVQECELDTVSAC